MSQLETLKDELLQLYETNKDTIHAAVSNEANQLRAKALQDFIQMGIPDKKNENYKYTNLEPYLTGDYLYELAPYNLEVEIEHLFKCYVPELDTHLVLMLNGFLNRIEIPVDKLPKGVIVCGLAEASHKYPEIVNQHLGKYAAEHQDSMASLNSLFFQDGIFIYVPDNVVLEKPIQIINIGFSTKSLRINRRNLFVAGKNSQLDVLICDHTLCNSSFLSNSLTEVFADENAIVDICRLQNENSVSAQISNIFVHQEATSKVTTNTLSLHGGLIRNNIFARLNGPGGDNNTYGLFLPDDNQHVSFFTRIHHAKPHCTSDQLVKGILDDFATGSFNGMIYVNEGAIKTEAYQRNNNMLLSDTAVMNTKPQLEIYNDDVKCSHGATTGQLDKDALFYLRARGISYKEARHLLMYAFANDVVRKIKLDALRDRIMTLVDRRLRGELTVCDNCSIRESHLMVN